jgi:hypothetical protein
MSSGSGADSLSGCSSVSSGSDSDPQEYDVCADTSELTHDPHRISKVKNEGFGLDDEFVPRDVAAVDDESTIQEAEQQQTILSAVTEMKTLHHESALPLEAIMKQYDQDGAIPATLQELKVEKPMMVRPNAF